MAAALILSPLNRLLGSPDAQDYGLARAAAGGAGSVREAVEAVGVLDQLPEDVRADARAELDALPPDVDRQILESLRGAFDRGSPIELTWSEVGAGTPISHNMTEAAGRVRIEIVAPDGRHFRG